jgi:N-acetylmuramic acid 6-phosphate etherase
MILSGKVWGNLMVDLQATCDKLQDRAQRILQVTLGVDRSAAVRLLERAGGRVKEAAVMHRLGVDAAEAGRRLEAAGGRIARVLGEED